MSSKREELINEFVEELKTRGWAKSSFIRAGEVVNYFFEYLKAYTKIKKITQITDKTLFDYQGYLFKYRKKDGTPLAKSTIHQRLIYLKEFFRFLVKRNYLLYEPTLKLTLPKRGKYLPKDVLTKEEILKLLSLPNVITLSGIRDKAILEVLYSTGIRKSELVNLNLYDIDLEAQILKIRHGKGKKDRLVPIGNVACCWVGMYLELVRPKYLKNEKEKRLFLTKYGSGLNESIKRIIKRYREEAGIKKNITTHSFRHTCATHLLEGGADIRYIQELLGHARIDTTQIYTKISSLELKKVIKNCHPRGKIKKKK